MKGLKTGGACCRPFTSVAKAGWLLAPPRPVLPESAVCMRSLKLLRVVVVTYPRGGGLAFMGGAFLIWKLLDF